jgi:phosphoenolpyruvate synthase/pyruvate phosphate dikinase
MSNLKAYPREPLETLKTYPTFQNLRAKAETHQLQFRPKESKRLMANGTFNQVLDERTQRAWNALSDCRRNGMNMIEAEEIALPNIQLPFEKNRRS